MLQALLLRGASPELALMERAVRKLTFLVEDLLESARLSRGKVQLQRRITELAQVIDRAVEQVSPLLADHRHKVMVSVPRVGMRVDADAERLARSIANVLTNASQHTPAGGRITIDAHHVGEAIQLRIVDEGSGIPTERLATVFQAFHDERGTGGLGLGLAIARGVVELHGGTIDVSSDGAGRGTACTFMLPGTAQPAEDQASPAARGRRRLLLVEDNDDTARALKAALEQLGYDVAVAHDAPIALNVAKTFQPDVALLDLGLPIMDGWELAKRLKTALDPLPIVAVTARDQESDKQRSAELGFAEHLVKPIDLPRLQRIVDELSASPDAES
jgi:CheY-like chemotaxis protein/anti-sigma regulatory factor (Ser/Thr protein kinase)